MLVTFFPRMGVQRFYFSLIKVQWDTARDRPMKRMVERCWNYGLVLRQQTYSIVSLSDLHIKDISSVREIFGGLCVKGKTACVCQLSIANPLCAVCTFGVQIQGIYVNHDKHSFLQLHCSEWIPRSDFQGLSPNLWQVSTAFRAPKYLS